jgi:hypothetical protein
MSKGVVSPPAKMRLGLHAASFMVQGMVNSGALLGGLVEVIVAGLRACLGAYYGLRYGGLGRGF